MDEDILRVKEFEGNINHMLIHVNLNRDHFHSFAEIIKMKNSLIDVIKNKLFDSEKLITRLNNKIKELHDTTQECRNLIV